MALLSLHNLTLSLGGPRLLDDAELNLEIGERVALVGRNGAGKSTLLKLLAGRISPDAGTLSLQNGATLAMLDQDAPPFAGRVRDIVQGGAPQAEEHEINALITRLQLPEDADYSSLSGGWKRRVALARTLAARPDALLLDEPTNHLDIAAIAWLEEFLLRHVKTLLFVTHDRAFLRRLATRIVELDRGKLRSFECSYDQFLERREALLEAEEKQSANFDTKLAEEEAWIRRGVKARTTRNEGRVRALQQMRQERQERRSIASVAKLGMQSADKSGHLVAELTDASFGFDGQTVIQPFSTTILRGDKVGIIGPNGSGKTTLLRGLLGQLAPRSGSVKIGTRQQIAYFDQMRQALDESQSVWQNVAGENDTVPFNGERRHIISYLRDFGFPKEQARMPVSTLSGGERNRLLLAKLWTQPANLLVMDEPTNDLDIETLDLMEELLLQFKGTLLLVSHDRDFLNNVVTGTMVFEGDGQVREYAGGYDDYVRARGGLGSNGTPPKTKDQSPKANTRARRMSFNEKRELEQLPARIEQMEAEQAALYEQMSDPDFYKNGDAATGKARMAAVEKELETAFARWEELEALAAA